MDSSKMFGNSPEVSNFNRLFLKLNHFICNQVNHQFSPSSAAAGLMVKLDLLGFQKTMIYIYIYMGRRVSHKWGEIISFNLLLHSCYDHTMWTMRAGLPPTSVKGLKVNRVDENKAFSIPILEGILWILMPILEVMVSNERSPFVTGGKGGLHFYHHFRFTQAH